MALTLADIRLQARQRADMVKSKFVTDSELNAYINNSLAELHDLLITSYNDDYYVESVEFSAVLNQLDYALPNGTNYSAALKFYKLRGVDVRSSDNSQWTNVKRFNFNKRNEDINNFAWNLLGNPYMEYRVVGSNIRFNRKPDSGMQFRLWYHPVAIQLTADTDVFEDINGYIEYVIVDAAIKMMQKEESDVSVLAAQKAAMHQRIVTSAANRDVNEPESVTDIYADEADFWPRKF
jgi:hypothetical protein